MGRRSYRIGADDERAVRVVAESVGCTVVRSAGSHGAADLIVSDTDRGEVWALDIKRNAWAGPRSRARMVEVWWGRATPVMVRVEVRGGRRVLSFRRVLRRGGLGVVTTTAPWDARARGRGQPASE